MPITITTRGGRLPVMDQTTPSCVTLAGDAETTFRVVPHDTPTMLVPPYLVVWTGGEEVRLVHVDEPAMRTMG